MSYTSDDTGKVSAPQGAFFPGLFPGAPLRRSSMFFDALILSFLSSIRLQVVVPGGQQMAMS